MGGVRGVGHRSRGGVPCAVCYAVAVCGVDDERDVVRNLAFDEGRPFRRDGPFRATGRPNVGGPYGRTGAWRAGCDVLKRFGNFGHEGSGGMRMRAEALYG